MTADRPKRLRCAVYTRKSSEEGLEQEFNSLHAQREACEAYTRSQAGEGWQLIKTAYDDGAYPGGTLARPALQQLLADIETRKVDTVVVYKVDRLTRSLADFARIVEVFDARNVSFVPVTQQFNTTSSMGRLTLNMLLSFAQFEHEVTGKRIRDKIAASKRKGLWMGGLPPLGYDVKDRKLVVKAREAETVRHIYRRYAALGSVWALKDEFDRDGIVSKLRIDKYGRRTGGRPLARGALYLMLQHRIYRGEIVHKENSSRARDIFGYLVHARSLPKHLWLSPRQSDATPSRPNAGGPPNGIGLDPAYRFMFQTLFFISNNDTRAYGDFLRVALATKILLAVDPPGKRNKSGRKKTMRAFGKAAAATVIGGALALTATSAIAEGLNITTTGGSARGFIKAVVESFHALYRDVYPGTSATFRPSSVAGGMVNVAKGNADISFALPQVELKAGLAGNAPFKEPLRGKLGAMMTFVDKLEFFIVAEKGWAEERGIKTLADIARKKPPVRLNLNRKGTFYAIEAAKATFKQYGFTLEDIKKWGGSVTNSSSGRQIQNMRDGKIDMIFNSSFHPDGRMLNLLKSRELVWIDADADKIAAAAKIVDMEPTTIPRGTYRFVKNDKPTMAAWLTMAAGTHVPAETVYKMVKAVAENLERVQAIHPMLKKFDKNMMTKKPADFVWHPGAAKYYRERGWIK